MFEIIQYLFFQNALIGVLLISISCALIGTYIVARRLVFISGGITHASFGGLGLGYYLGIYPTITALLFAITSSFGVEWLSKRKNIREDSAIAVFWSLGMAIGVIFIFLTPGYTPGLTEFLFGNILTITRIDLLLFAIFTLVTLLFFGYFYYEIYYISFDRDFASTQNLPVRVIEYALILLVSICIVLTIRLIGIMLLMSMITIPQNIANLFTNRFKNMMIVSAATSILCGVTGLFLSFLLNVPSSACIIIVLVIGYILCRLFKSTFYAQDNDKKRLNI